MKLFIILIKAMPKKVLYESQIECYSITAKQKNNSNDQSLCWQYSGKFEGSVSWDDVHAQSDQRGKKDGIKIKAAKRM